MTQRKGTYHDRDYTEEFDVTLEWGEWNHLFSLAATRILEKEREGDWPEDVLERDQELRKNVAAKIGEGSPGNGMDDWPDSMKKAWDETVREMIEDV